ncbi:flagellar biosynthesis anti-sigma factor FlgM [Accumulibacter sp.]|uniref:flagellar biosynthesis anti-sigma factor FlgM n=1 Tax=Accumulibacter sp. TaxID=2053492 RepID=UPI001D2F35AF|nr:flagellar biosynthesis anti-sigma factor FlgM [Accumulibacter sp.]MCB1932382.1 flagellar biosynthesis anti-sigma factor FlgM [Accumulibacter sp.]MCB1964737.1 flagellar biosynthesis anti-sigma factor FlgM [Accumulibacter sp.]MCP5228377.1 flagellar biosynthesis anti-sigma factor FlgM [Accumulibacter sp.]
MKIDSTTTGTNTVSSETRSRSSTAGKPAASAAAEVHLSEMAGRLQAAGETPAFDATRVAEIKQAIAEGRFTINAEAVADRLIASASELISSQRQR